MHLKQKFVLEGARTSPFELCHRTGSVKDHEGFPCRRMWRSSVLKDDSEQYLKSMLLLANHFF